MTDRWDMLHFGLIPVSQAGYWLWGNLLRVYMFFLCGCEIFGPDWPGPGHNMMYDYGTTALTPTGTAPTERWVSDCSVPVCVYLNSLCVCMCEVWRALLWITLSPNKWQSFSLRRSHTWTNSSWHKVFTWGENNIMNRPSCSSFLLNENDHLRLLVNLILQWSLGWLWLVPWVRFSENWSTIIHMNPSWNKPAKSCKIH